MLTLEEFEKIMNNESIRLTIFDNEEDSTLTGLNLIAKYLPTSGVEGSEHDRIYGADASALIEAGLTKADAIKLKELNWMIKDDCLQSYV